MYVLSSDATAAVSVMAVCNKRLVSLLIEFIGDIQINLSISLSMQHVPRVNSSATRPVAASWRLSTTATDSTTAVTHLTSQRTAVSCDIYYTIVIACLWHYTDNAR